jgi:release factor glutamine methyltransferase
VNCRNALARARQTLEKSGIENSLLEGEILVRFVLRLDRAGLFSNLDLELTSSQIYSLSNLLQSRQSGEPSAYITGHKEFYGLDFKVDPRVLIPRPETELIVEKAIEIYRKYNYISLADIGTGSGCIAISLAKELQKAEIYAVDYSAQALEVARDNAIKHGVNNRIHFLNGSLLEPLPQAVDMVIANLPYVKRNEVNSQFEPVLALNGGEDGLDIIRELIVQTPDKLTSKGVLILEVGQGQATKVESILHKVFPEAVIEVFKDLAGIERVVSMRLTA